MNDDYILMDGLDCKKREIEYEGNPPLYRGATVPTLLLLLLVTLSAIIVIIIHRIIIDCYSSII